MTGVLLVARVLLVRREVVARVERGGVGVAVADIGLGRHFQRHAVLPGDDAIAGGQDGDGRVVAVAQDRDGVDDELLVDHPSAEGETAGPDVPCGQRLPAVPRDGVKIRPVDGVDVGAVGVVVSVADGKNWCRSDSAPDRTSAP